MTVPYKLFLVQTEEFCLYSFKFLDHLYTEQYG